MNEFPAIVIRHADHLIFTYLVADIEYTLEVPATVNNADLKDGQHVQIALGITRHKKD